VPKPGKKSWWYIYGADRNVDWGGSHVQPLLGIFHGTEAEANAFAYDQPLCKDAWGGNYSGAVKPATVLKPKRGRK
jgi:hypothetical protein